MMKILLIEDDLADQLIFKRNIKKCVTENELIIADSILSGKDVLSKQKIDFIFCDFNLPDGNALQILEEEITKEGPPVIVLTSHGDVQKATESLKKGAFDFITKDNINTTTLERIINNVLRTKEEVSRRRELEKRLEVNNANTRAILDNTLDGIWSLDNNQRLLIVNEVAIENFIKHFNYKPSIGDDFFEHLNEELISIFKPLYDKAAEGHSSTSISEHIETDYSYFLEVSCSPIMKDDEFHGAIFFGRSVTKRVEAEKKLEEAKNLAEETSLFKSKFLANMSHEIRTPMNAMLGFSDLLMKTSLSSEQREYAEIIQYSGEDLLIIVNDILDLSKIQAGKMELRLESLDLNEILSYIIQLNSKKVKERGSQLNLNCEDAVPKWILADSTRLTQILNNLISNANKFTENGSVELHVEQIEQREDSFILRFTVSDTGIGIPEDQLESIFQEFSQVDSSLQRVASGTGLGLSIVSNLVHLMNGTINVKSQLGKGSEFIIDLPLKIGEPQQVKKDNSEKNKKILIGKKILVCEDIELNRLLAKKVLDQFGGELYFAENGKEGIDMVKSISPDLVLMDIQMPIMNGYDATKEIRKFSNVPIIAMTAHMLDEEKLKCESVGMNGFIPKPFKEKDILDQMDIALNTDLVENVISEDKWVQLNMPTLESLAGRDEEFVLEILEIFLDTAEQRVHEFEKAISENDLDKEAQIAHIFRSSFSTFDLLELRDLSVEIEKGDASEKDKKHFADLIRAAIILVTEKKALFSI